MIKVHTFTFGPFQENTFLLEGTDGSCIIVDPGMSNPSEQEELDAFISSKGLNVQRLLNTHGHIDHVLGNKYICDTYSTVVEAHPLAAQTIAMAEMSSKMYGIPYDPSPEIAVELNEGDTINLDGDTLDILFTPGHAPGHIVFVNHHERWVVNGDVLFKGSVGRVDLPGSNPPDLVKSILEKMYTLPEDYVVYTGHGPSTTIGAEMESNPFVNKRTTLDSLF